MFSPASACTGCPFAGSLAFGAAYSRAAPSSWSPLILLCTFQLALVSLPSFFMHFF